MNNIVLSIHYGHNATVGISINGKVECVISEERISRLKNATGFPFLALDYIIRTYLDGDINKVSKVVLNDEELAGVQMLECWGYDCKKTEDYFYKNKKNDDLSYFINKESKKNFRKRIKNYIKKIFVDQKYQSPFPFENSKEELLEKIASKINIDKSKITTLHHHKSHALSAMYFLNDEEKRLIFTLDGEGDSTCATVNIFENGVLNQISTNNFNNSIGLIYYYITGFLGMKPNEHEFKVMGMAPYAKKEQVLRVKKYFDDLISLEEGLFFSKIPTHINKDISHYFIKNLTYERFDNICGAVQLFTEEIIIKWVDYWIKKTGISSIVLSGGVFMNVKANKKVCELDSVKDMFVVPSCGDESLVIGGLYYGNTFINQQTIQIKDLYLGRSFDDNYTIKFLNTVKDRYSFKKLSIDEMAVEVAKLLANNQIVARCVGREEWGARALGNRSILCNPSHFKNLDTLNQYIKDRDFWMPFTPTILEEDINKYIVNPKKIKPYYMSITFDSTELARQKMPAALHPYDYTVRPQTINESWNKGYYKIIKEFKKITGISALLNTSFNLHGEPNVSNPEDAIHTLDNSKLKYVIIGNYLVEKYENIQ